MITAFVLSGGRSLGGDQRGRTVPRRGTGRMSITDTTPAGAPRLRVHSLCQHHLLPFHGVAQIGYLPGEFARGVLPARRSPAVTQLTRVPGGPT